MKLKPVKSRNLSLWMDILTNAEVKDENVPSFLDETEEMMFINIAGQISIVNLIKIYINPTCLIEAVHFLVLNNEIVACVCGLTENLDNRIMTGVSLRRIFSKVVTHFLFKKSKAAEFSLSLR